VARAGVAAVREAIGRARIDGYSAGELQGRFDQFHEESEVIIPAVTEALQRGDVSALGALVDRSQAGAEALLRNQISETILLARSARELGAVAASAFGAGFGGSVWALVPEANAESFMERWRAEYLRTFPAHRLTSQFFSTHAGPPAGRLS
jgi:galactokinase